MIELKAVRAEDRDFLWKALQEYLREMSAFYPVEMDEKGNYVYKYFDAYFRAPERKAFLFSKDEEIVGFAMLNPYSAIGHKPDYTIAEFTIFPPYRGRNYGLEAAKLLLSTYPGRWEIKYNEGNVGARKLWTSVSAPYMPAIFHLDGGETVLEFIN